MFDKLSLISAKFFRGNYDVEKGAEVAEMVALTIENPEGENKCEYELPTS